MRNATARCSATADVFVRSRRDKKAPIRSCPDKQDGAVVQREGRKAMAEFKCSEVKECLCTNVECERYGKCCACVAHHRNAGNYPVCLRDLPKQE